MTDGGLSAGAVAGLIIGILVGVAVLVIVLVVIYIRYARSKQARMSFGTKDTTAIVNY